MSKDSNCSRVEPNMIYHYKTYTGKVKGILSHQPCATLHCAVNQNKSAICKLLLLHLLLNDLVKHVLQILVCFIN